MKKYNKSYINFYSIIVLNNLKSLKFLIQLFKIINKNNEDKYSFGLFPTQKTYNY